MMQLTRDNDNIAISIQSYQLDRLIVNETLYQESVILTTHTIMPWPPKTWESITAVDIEALLAYSPQVVLLGTGEHQRFLSSAILQPLLQQRIGVEMMSTLSACYTFKVLAAEKRAVVAGLIV